MIRTAIQFTLIFFISAVSLFGSTPTKSMTLSDVIQRSLKTVYAKNTEMMKEISQLDRQLSQRIYDPRFDLNGAYLSNEWEQGNSFSPNIEASSLGFTGSKAFTTGTRVGIGTTVSHQKQDFKTFADVSYHEAQIGLNMEQDLLQNAFGRQDKLRLHQQDLLNELKQLDITDALEETVYQATVGFWEVVYTQKTLETAEQALENSKKLYDLNVKKKKTGLSEERTVLAFKANWHLKQLAYSIAKTNYEQARDLFQTTLELKEMPSLDENVAQLLAMVNTTRFIYDWEQQHTLLRRYKMAELSVDQKGLSVKTALDQTRPELLLFGSTTYNGIDSKFNESQKQALDFEHLNAQVGFKLRFTSGRSAQYTLQRALLEKSIQENNKKLMTQELQLGVKNALRLVLLLKENLNTTALIESTMQAKYKEDLTQYNAGRINVNDLLQSDDQLHDAKLSALKAQYEYLQAVGFYYRVTNTLLQRIEILSTATKGTTHEEIL